MRQDQEGSRQTSDLRAESLETNGQARASLLLEAETPLSASGALMRRWYVLVGSLAIVPSTVSAQHHSAMSVGIAAARPGAVSSRVGIRAVPTVTTRISPGTQSATRAVAMHPRNARTAVTVIRTNNNQLRRPADFDEDEGFFDDFNGVPGLGFDEVHLAATRGPRAVGAHRFDRFNTGFFPLFDGGFLFPSSMIVEQPPANEAHPEEVAEPETQESTRRVRSREAAPAYLTETEAGPQRESEQYVFVRRDGTLFFAVAYSWDNQTLRYVTQEGLRRSVTREALDLPATQQFNEQRGLNFILPA
jgi:hypothetical protein